MPHFEVKIKANFEAAWLSYLGAVSGVLKSLGSSSDIIDLAGYSGYAFVINVNKQTTCPSGPTALKVWNDIHRGTELLGWKLSISSKKGGFPQNNPPNKKDLRHIKHQFKIVKKSLQKTNRPVVVWGIPIPEYGIVNGYNGNSYIVSTFRSIIKAPDTSIPFNTLQSPGMIEAIAFEKPIIHYNQKEKDIIALQRIHKIISSDQALENYIAGPQAFDQWVHHLHDLNSVNYQGNSYVAACTHEAFCFAEAFLLRLAQRYREQPISVDLELASQEYEKAKNLLKEFTTLFPFAETGDLSEIKRVQGADLLIKSKSHIIEGIRKIEDVCSKVS